MPGGEGAASTTGRARVVTLILILAAVAIVVTSYVPSRRRPASLLPNARDPSHFTVCFRPPVPSDPPDEVTSAVKTATEDLEPILRRVAPSAGIRASWIRALVTHESGGNRHAISPTDCAGLVAISPVHLQSYSPCCVDDPEDHAEYGYDLCNSEERTGYRCDMDRDPRFDVRYSLEFAARNLAAFQLETAGALARNPGIFIPVVWNLGASAVVGFPSSIGDLHDVFSKLNFDLRGGYGWAGTHDLVNKIVEVFDWIVWFDYLDGFWRGERTAKKPGGIACIRYDPGRQIGGNRLWFTNPAVLDTADGRMTSLRIKRLAFGRYSEDFVHLTSDGGLPRSP